MVPTFDHIGDQRPKHRRELERVPAVARCDQDAGPIRIARDPEVPVGGIAVEADAGVDDGRIVQQRERVGQKVAQLTGLFDGD